MGSTRASPRAEMAAHDVSHRSGRQPGGARLTQQLREACGFRFRDATAERRDAVVAPPDIVTIRMTPIVDLLDEAIVEHALDRAIERARTHAQLAVRPRADVLHDRVAVPLAVGDAHEDVKDGDWESSHRRTITRADILTTEARVQETLPVRRAASTVRVGSAPLHVTSAVGP
jgi:hypothetical protein